MDERVRMTIDTSGVEAVFKFNSKEHILVFDNHEWTICPRIDRSYKGKDDDIGMPIVHLTNQEAESLKASGFTWTELQPLD